MAKTIIVEADTFGEGWGKQNAMNTELYTGLDGKVNSVVKTVSTATYDVLVTDGILHVTRTTAGACTITIPTALIVANFTLQIKDGGLNATTNNITVVGEGGELIDGSASAIITTSGNAISLYSDGTNLFIY